MTPKPPPPPTARTPLLPLAETSPSATKQQPPPSSSVILRVCSFILTAEFCLCLAGATLTGSLPIFFRKRLGLDSVRATELNSALQALFNLTPILGAYVADKHLGRFNTIAISCAAYVVGLAMCTLASTPTFSSLPLFVVGLYGCVALASGGIKPNVVVLGADQFDLDDPAQRTEKASFFNWFYWSVNIGSFISYSVLANVSVNGIPGLVPESWGFSASFLVATVAYFLGLIVFVSGKNRYRRLPPKGSALSGFFAVLVEAGGSTTHGRVVLSAGLAFVPGIVLTTISYFVTSPVWHLGLALGGALCVVYGTVVLILSGGSTTWVRRAARVNGGTRSETEVKDVRQVMRLLPYMSIIIIFWASYSQMKSNFLLQGCQMDLRLGPTSSASLTPPTGHPALVSSAMLSILNSGSILVFIPIFDRLIYPTLSAVGLHPTLLRKIGAGLLVSLVAMLIAAWIEQERKQSPIIEGIPSNCASSAEALPMSELSVWWQTLQYLLIGVSEILTSITSYDLFYSEVPESMRSACQALNLLAITLGYIVSGALNSIFSFWVTTDLNDGKLEYIFYVVALLLLVDLVAFIHVSSSFQYTVPQTTPQSDLVSGFSPAVARAARALIHRMTPRRTRRKSARAG